MAKKNPESTGDRKVRVLVDCWAGTSGQVVTLSEAEADALVSGGEGDDHPSAVKAGEE